jgi:D-serine deaminase-like pyridoxal phosphate-dependent protein
MKQIYELEHTEELISPCLIYYLEIIRENTEKAIKMAGSADRLWPHVKSHKSIDMVKLQIGYGIKKFKTATIAEAEMAAEAGAEQVILAYPLVGLNIRRFLNLEQAYPQTVFYAIGDDKKQLMHLSDECEKSGCTAKVLIDVNMGMNRTGVELWNLESLYRYADTLPGIQLKGLHCYDGNHNQKDIAERDLKVEESDSRIQEIINNLRSDSICCEFAVAGGTPSFPCHIHNSDWYLSPGTAFITDAGYYNNLPDLNFVPGAALFTRVVSHPSKGLFTLDLGYKGIAADPAVQRGYIIGMNEAAPVLHSEEHWVFQIEEDRVPPIGTGLYVIPTHICPTTALYHEILVAEKGRITETWKVTARNRKINY